MKTSSHRENFLRIVTLHFYIILWWKNDFCDFWSCYNAASQHAACTDSPPIVIDELVKCENWRILETIKENDVFKPRRATVTDSGSSGQHNGLVLLCSKCSDHFESIQMSWWPDLFWFNNTICYYGGGTMSDFHDFGLTWKC